MKYLFQTSLVAILTLAAFSSCKKESETPEETIVKATIDVEDPLADFTYEQGDTVHIHFGITCANEMHGYEAMLINLTSGDTAWDAHLHDHGQSYHVENFWVNNVTEHSDMRLKVIAILDHEENQTVKQVDFHCHP
jgi:hypothetical protein